MGAAVGFPLGQSTPKVKKYETVDAIANGADEIDYVINITQLKEKNYDFIEHEMAGIVEECRGAGVISKVIFENCYLTARTVFHRAGGPPGFHKDVHGLWHRRRNL